MYCTVIVLLRLERSINFSDCVPHFLAILLQKNRKLQWDVAQTRHTLTVPPHPDSTYTGLPFDTPSTVPSAEVLELLSIIPLKSCSMCFIQTAFTARCTICIAQYCYCKSSVRLSVCLFVCPSVTLMYLGDISSVSSKVIRRLISIGSLLVGAPTSEI